MNLSSEKLQRDGLFLLENGFDMFLWVGVSISPEACKMLFDRPNFEAIPSGKVRSFFNSSMRVLQYELKDLKPTAALTPEIQKCPLGTIAQYYQANPGSTNDHGDEFPSNAHHQRGRHRARPPLLVP